MSNNKRLTAEFANTNKQSPGGCKVELIEDDLNRWRVSVPGPAGSPFNGKTLYLNMFFPKNYPFKEPDVSFSPAIFHPNVDEKSGAFCAFGGQYKQTMKMVDVLKNAVEILKNPNPESFVNDEAAKLFSNNRAEYERRAANSCK